MLLDVILDPAQAFRVVDHGPSPTDPGIEEFKALWGNKSELRRFKNGSILECLVWEGIPKDRIIGEILGYILKTHFQVAFSQSIGTSRGLEALLQEKPPVSNFDAAPALTSFAPIMDVFHTLVKRLKSLENVPLTVNSVLPVDPILRNTSTFIPQPHGRFCDPIELILNFETSLSWPDDLAAFQQTKTALFVKIAQELNRDKETIARVYYPLEQSIKSETHLEILVPEGFLFWIRIHVDRETAILEKLVLGGLKKHDAEELRVIKAARKHHKTLFTNLPALHSHITNLARSEPAFGPTVRLVKRWMACHWVSAYVQDSWVECLVANVFINSLSYQAPQTPLTGLKRFLLFLSQYSSASGPITLDFDNSMTSDTKSLIQKKFLDAIKEGAEICVFSNDDLTGSVFGRVGKVVAKRLQGLAKASVKVLQLMWVDETVNIKVCRVSFLILLFQFL